MMTASSEPEKSVEQLYIESLLARRESGIPLTAGEEAAVGYSVYGTAAGCTCGCRKD